MSSVLLPSDLKQVARRLRIVAILDGADRLGISPLGLLSLHSIAYFADALAPVWNLPIMDGQVLKRRQPYYPSLQEDLDRLVGQGVVDVRSVTYTETDPGSWLLDAQYYLRREFSDPILQVAGSFVHQASELAFVREVVYATSGLGNEGVEKATAVDATYADPLVDIGGMIEVDPEDSLNLTAGVALRFGQLLGRDADLSTAEMVNLYVRRLYSRMQVA